MDLLARREHSQLELKRKLGGRFDPVELDAAIQLLTEENLQSDARFARSYTRERMLRGFGPLRIEHDLKQRGVANDSISTALTEVAREEGVSWIEVAASALSRRFGAQPPETIDDKARRIRYLRYRGFSEMPPGLGPGD
jgi:regulatory protein